MGKYSTEILTHFNCGACGKWWSIADCETEQREWFCPWCGVRQTFEAAKRPESSGPPPATSPNPTPDPR